MSRICNHFLDCSKERSETFKVYMALLAAGVVPATLFVARFMFDGGADLDEIMLIWFLTFIIAFFYASLLGVPVFLFARKHGWLSWWFSSIAGFLVGAVAYKISDTSYIMDAIGYGLLGMAGGLAAWVVWRGSGYGHEESGGDHE